ncbi:Sortase, partial [Bifidobacterium saguini DSM 23967]
MSGFESMAAGCSPPEWEDVIRGVDRTASRMTRTRLRRNARHARMVARMLGVVAVVSMLCSLSVFAWAFCAQAANAREDAATAAGAVSSAGHRIDGMISKAREYNKRLAASPQSIGEPLAADGAAAGDFTFDGDRDYQSQLDLGDGIMGTLRIPRIGLELPIRHGAGEYALSNGLGHLHGTSLPVGGASTHAVITGHRGLVDKELFTRLDELREGDPFYIELGEGRILAYVVTGMRVVDPDDTESLAVMPGDDLVTLVTCTPIMLNTRRLLVTGRRASMPDAAPYPAQAEGDGHPKGVGMAVMASAFAVG